MLSIFGGERDAQIDAKQCGALIQYGKSHNSNFLSLLIELIVVVIW